MHNSAMSTDINSTDINSTDINSTDINSTDMGVIRESLFSYSINSPATNIVLIILFTIVITWTVLGNLTVILSVKRTRALRECPSNVLVANLAFSDLLLGIMVLPLSAMVEVFNYWPLPKELCFFWLVIDVLICTASIWGLVAIATDRYSATFYPVWYRTQYRRPRILIYITTVWVISTLTSIPVLFGFGSLLQKSYQGATSPEVCALTVTIDYAMYSSAMTFIVPATFLFILYGRIFAEIRRRTKEVAKMKSKFKRSMQVEGAQHHQIERKLQELEHEESTSQNEESTTESVQIPMIAPLTSSQDEPEQETNNISPQSEQQLLQTKPPPRSEAMHGDIQQNISIFKRMASKMKTDRKEERATKIMLTIMLFFIICWLPFFIMYITRTVLDRTCPDCIPLSLQSVLIWLGYLNSAGNPILYAAFNRQFKDAFIAIWCSRIERFRQSNRRI